MYNIYMSKKTREDKVASRARRRAALIRELAGNQSISKTHSPLSQQPSASSETIIKKRDEGHTDNPIAYFRHDLTKSVILTTFIIALEIAIYFVSIKF